MCLVRNIVNERFFVNKLSLSYYDFYQFLLTFSILIIGLFLCFIIGAKNRKGLTTIFFLYIWHTFFSFYYWFYSLSNTADATLYYQKSFRVVFNFNPGTRFTETLVSIVANSLESNYLNTTLVFNIFGSIGLTLLYLTLKDLLKKINGYWILIIFLPSMSFWSAGLGKDSISFLATCLFLYSVLNSNRTIILMPLAFFIMFMVRPHIAAMMLLSYFIYFIIKAKVHIVFKLVALPVISIALIFALQYVQQYAGIDEASLNSIDSYIDKRQNSNLGGGSSLDISSMSYPMQMFTYIFRPLPFEAHSLLALITSLENTLFLLIFIYLIYKSNFNFHSYIKEKNLWLLMYVFLTCTALAVTTANLGIATRQKWMFMPVLIYLLVFSFYEYKRKKVEL